MDYPGWTYETSHPVDQADPDYCATCADAIGPAIAFAEANDSWAYGTEIQDEAGTHTIVVRKVVE